MSTWCSAPDFAAEAAMTFPSKRAPAAALTPAQV
jgi:hypothetical protein